MTKNFKNADKTLRNRGDSRRLNIRDFPGAQKLQAILYGIYGVGYDTGFVNIETAYDTASFAVSSIHGWWKRVGKKLFPSLKYLLFNFDDGISDGDRIILWKYELQKLANTSRVPIRVRQFPPGVREWNKVERGLFSFFSTNWKGHPFRDYETYVNLISHDYSAKELKVKRVFGS
jgi:hypothetical protein